MIVPVDLDDDRSKRPFGLELFTGIDARHLNFERAAAVSPDAHFERIPVAHGRMSFPQDRRSTRPDATGIDDPTNPVPLVAAVKLGYPIALLAR